MSDLVDELLNADETPRQKTIRELNHICASGLPIEELGERILYYCWTHGKPDDWHTVFSVLTLRAKGGVSGYLNFGKPACKRYLPLMVEDGLIELNGDFLRATALGLKTAKEKDKQPRAAVSVGQRYDAPPAQPYQKGLPRGFVWIQLKPLPAGSTDVTVQEFLQSRGMAVPLQNISVLQYANGGSAWIALPHEVIEGLVNKAVDGDKAKASVVRPKVHTPTVPYDGEVY